MGAESSGASRGMPEFQARTDAIRRTVDGKPAGPRTKSRVRRTLENARRWAGPPQESVSGRMRLSPFPGRRESMGQLTPNRDPQAAPPRRKPDSLPDRLAIFELVARFEDALKRRDRVRFRSLWAGDAIWEVCDPLPMRMPGTDQDAGLHHNMVGQSEQLFRGSFGGIVILDGDKAKGRWPCIRTRAGGGAGQPPGCCNRAIHEDTYVKRDGRWLFSSRRRLHLWMPIHRLPGHAVPLGQEVSR